MVWVMGGKGPGPTGTGRGLQRKESTFQPPKTPQPSLEGLSQVPPQLPLWNHPCWIINRWAVLIYHQPCTYIAEGGNKGYSRPRLIAKAWHMLLIHLDNTVTSSSVKNCPTEEEFVCSLTARYSPTHATPPIMDEYLFIISVHKSGCQSPTQPAYRCLICIVRLRRRKRNKVCLYVGDGGRWWIELSPHHGTFVNVWLVLNGLLLDYRVWGPNLDTVLLLRDSPLRVSRDRIEAACWQRARGEEGGGHACLCRVVKMFDNAVAPCHQILTFLNTLEWEIKGGVSWG